MNLHARQVEREKSMPVFVRFLCTLDCWIVGSRADFRQDRVKDTSDWDLLVPFHAWERVAQAILAADVTGTSLRPTRYGGWRFDVERREGGVVVVDAFAGDIGAWLTKPHTLAAWHPRTGTILEKPLDAAPRSS